MEILSFIHLGLWAGFAGLGFAILFNVPQRTLLYVWGFAGLGGFLKYFLISVGITIVPASLVSATTIGVLSVFASQSKNAPPLVFSIPAVIPLVPGAFTYKMILGFMKLVSLQTDSTDYIRVLTETIGYGLKSFFIFCALAAGVAIPMLITRKNSFKRIKSSQESDSHD